MLRGLCVSGAQDPEPEKLNVPKQKLDQVVYAARDVMRNAGGSSNMAGSDGPRARRRYVGRRALVCHRA